jgi:hypothetical protein
MSALFQSNKKFMKYKIIIYNPQPGKLGTITFCTFKKYEQHRWLECLWYFLMHSSLSDIA